MRKRSVFIYAHYADFKVRQRLKTNLRAKSRHGSIAGNTPGTLARRASECVRLSPKLMHSVRGKLTQTHAPTRWRFGLVFG